MIILRSEKQMPLKSRWKVIIAEMDISQKELAKKLEVTPQQLNNWIRMNPNPRLDTLFKVAKIIGVKVDDLYEYIEED